MGRRGKGGEVERERVEREEKKEYDYLGLLGVPDADSPVNLIKLSSHY